MGRMQDARHDIQTIEPKSKTAKHLARGEAHGFFAPSRGAVLRIRDVAGQRFHLDDWTRSCQHRGRAQSAKEWWLPSNIETSVAKAERGVEYCRHEV